MLCAEPSSAVGKNQVLNLNRHAVLLDPFQAPVHYQKRLYQVNPEGQSSPAAGCATKISVSGQTCTGAYGRGRSRSMCLHEGDEVLLVRGFLHTWNSTRHNVLWVGAAGCGVAATAHAWRRCLQCAHDDSVETSALPVT